MMFGLEKLVDSLPPWLRHSAMLLIFGVGLGISYAGFSGRLDAAERDAQDAKALAARVEKKLEVKVDAIDTKVNASLVVQAAVSAKVDDLKEQNSEILGAVLGRQPPPKSPGH
jgi:hypothetical protein